MDRPWAGTSTSPAPRFGGPGLFGGDVLNVNAKADLSWLGTTRARLGCVVTPDNRLMIYATGGVAYGGGGAHFNVSTPPPAPSFRAARVLRGWAGPSAAALNTPSPTTSRSRANICTPRLAATTSIRLQIRLLRREFPLAVATAKLTYNASIFRAGVNYKF